MNYFPDAFFETVEIMAYDCCLEDDDDYINTSYGWGIYYSLSILAILACDLMRKNA